MDSCKRMKLEYEHMLFGFSSDAFIDAFKAKLREVISEDGVGDHIKMLKGKLLPAAENPELAEKCIEEMGQKLITQYERGVDYGMSRVEADLRQCFSIPDNVLLPEDEIIAQVQGVDEEVLELEVEALKGKLKNIAYLLEVAKKEEALANETIRLLEKTAALKISPPPQLEL